MAHQIYGGTFMAWLRRGTLVRPSAAVAATAVVAVIAAVAVWESLRGGTASRRLLTPIIEYHESQYEINRHRWQSDLDGASDRMERTRSSFDNLTRMSDDASGLPKEPRPFRVDAWERVRFDARGLVGAIGGVGDRLRDASLHENMTIYHSHMKFYYEGLLKDRVAWLPTLPEPLAVERRMIELELRRRYGDLPDERDEHTLLRRYEAEPPRHLAPRAAMPKPRDSPAAPPPR